MRLGALGEDIAARYVEQLGWKILDRNWRCAYGEIDLVAYDGTEIVVIEVRTRRGKHALGQAVASVDQRKRRRLRRLAELYRQQLPDDMSVRVDVLGIAQRGDDLFDVEMVRDVLGW